MTKFSSKVSIYALQKFYLGVDVWLAGVSTSAPPALERPLFLLPPYLYVTCVCWMLSVGRYFFKTASEEFDCGGVVHQEVFSDDELLPMWRGKIVGKVEEKLWLTTHFGVSLTPRLVTHDQRDAVIGPVSFTHVSVGLSPPCNNSPVVGTAV